jgi:hypothetical protein
MMTQICIMTEGGGVIRVETGTLASPCAGAEFPACCEDPGIFLHQSISKSAMPEKELR